MNTSTVARNSFWYALETGIGFVTGIATSIAIARVLGPVKLGHVTYIAWLIAIAGSLGTFGVPAAACKYMSECLGRKDAATARAIFDLTFRFQARIATVLAIASGCLAWWCVDAAMRPTALLLCAAMWPAMVIAIPSQANAAREDLFANVPSALIANAIYAGGVALTLLLSWDTAGLAATLLAMRSVELAVRVVPVLRWRASLPAGGPIGPELRRRLTVFSRQSAVLLLLAVVVWDRSEVLALRYFSDIRQLAFYTVAFNITDRLRTIPQTFHAAIAATIMAQFGRNPAGVGAILTPAIRYMALVAAPVYVGVAMLAAPIMLLAYGAKYAETAALLPVAALLALPRVVAMPVHSALAALDKQHLLVRWNVAIAVLNIGLDLFLIPRYHAMGAVAANGVAQGIAAAGLCWYARRELRFRDTYGTLARVACAALAMAGTMALLPATGSRAMDILAGMAAGGAAFAAAIRLLRALDAPDRKRLLLVAAKMPAMVRPACVRAVRALSPLAERGVAVS